MTDCLGSVALCCVVLLWESLGLNVSCISGLYSTVVKWLLSYGMFEETMCPNTHYPSVQDIDHRLTSACTHWYVLCTERELIHRKWQHTKGAVPNYHSVGVHEIEHTYMYVDMVSSWPWVWILYDPDLCTAKLIFLWKITTLGKLCCVALSLCCVVLALPCLSKHLLND